MKKYTSQKVYINFFLEYVFRRLIMKNPILRVGDTVDHTLSQKSLTSKNITLTYILPYIIITILCILEYIWCLVHMGGLIFHHTSLTLMACTLKLKTFQDI